MNLNKRIKNVDSEVLLWIFQLYRYVNPTEQLCTYSTDTVLAKVEI